MTNSAILYTLGIIISCNLPLILFSVIGFLFAKKHNPLVWFIIGLILMLLSYYGNYTRLTNVSPYSIISIDLEHEKSLLAYEFIFTILYFCITLYFALKRYKKKKAQKNGEISIGLSQTKAENYETQNQPKANISPDSNLDHSVFQNNFNIEKSVDAEQTQANIYCSCCGTQLIKDAQYCFNCGQKTNDETTPIRFCRFCGAKVETNYKFCNECGRKIGK